MSATWLALGSSLLSGAAVALLALRDPERRKLSARRRGAIVDARTAARAERMSLAALALLPGGLLAASGAGAASMIWAGASLMWGWTVTLGMRSVR